MVEAKPYDRVVEDREEHVADRQRKPDTAHVDAQPTERHQDRLLADYAQPRVRPPQTPHLVGVRHAPRRAQPRGHRQEDPRVVVRLDAYADCPGTRLGGIDSPAMEAQVQKVVIRIGNSSA